MTIITLVVPVLSLTESNNMHAFSLMYVCLAQVGIDFCHDRGILNRDMKLENTLLQVGYISPCRCLSRP